MFTAFNFFILIEKLLILGVEPRMSAHKTKVITVSPYELLRIYVAILLKSRFTTTAGLEPARECRNRFLVYLLNRSDKLPFT